MRNHDQCPLDARPPETRRDGRMPARHGFDPIVEDVVFGVVDRATSRRPSAQLELVVVRGEASACPCSSIGSRCSLGSTTERSCPSPRIPSPARSPSMNGSAPPAVRPPSERAALSPRSPGRRMPGRAPQESIRAASASQDRIVPESRRPLQHDFRRSVRYTTWTRAAVHPPDHRLHPRQGFLRSHPRNLLLGQ